MVIPAELIRDSRRRSGLSQSQVAYKAGTSQSAIARYEKGSAIPSIETLNRLIQACGHRLIVAAEQMEPSVLSPHKQFHKFRRQIIECAYAHGASNVRVFGSVARGEDQPGSDLDLLVDLDLWSDGVNPLIELQQELQGLLNIPVDVVTFELLRPEVRKRVESEALPL